MFFKQTSRQVYIKLKGLSGRFCRVTKQFSLHGMLVRLLLISLGLNLLLFLMQETSLGRHIGFSCKRSTVWKNQSYVNNHTTEGKTKGRIIMCLEDGVTVASDDALLAGEHLDKKVFLTIGIPSIKRKSRSYLTTTLDSLLYNVSSAKDFSTKIVILLADIKNSVRQKRLLELSSRYGKYLANGDIHVITVPAEVYPPLHGLSKTLDDTDQRIFWRSKQVIDFAFLMQYCKSFSPYYLQLEDDVIATRHYDVYMRRYMKEKEGTYWFNLDFSNLGFIGKLYRSETLENQARFFRLFYTEMPVDLLMNAYRTILGNEVGEITYFRNLFLHIGYESSSLSR